MNDRNQHYDDPLDLIWTATAHRLGFDIARSGDVYASYDGAGTITLGGHETLDPDDCLAQMILHELCHCLVQGPESISWTDWGLENIDDRDLVREHATHRLQAQLTTEHGLRRMLAVTTDWRPYYDALPDDPLADGDDPAIPIARAAHTRAMRGEWGEVIQEALLATAVIAEAVRDHCGEDSLWSAATTVI